MIKYHRYFLQWTFPGITLLKPLTLITTLVHTQLNHYAFQVKSPWFLVVLLAQVAMQIMCSLEQEVYYWLHLTTIVYISSHTCCWDSSDLATVGTWKICGYFGWITSSFSFWVTVFISSFPTASWARVNINLSTLLGWHLLHQPLYPKPIDLAQFSCLPQDKISQQSQKRTQLHFCHSTVWDQPNYGVDFSEIL